MEQAMLDEPLEVNVCALRVSDACPSFCWLPILQEPLDADGSGSTTPIMRKKPSRRAIVAARWSLAKHSSPIRKISSEAMLPSTDGQATNV